MAIYVKDQRAGLYPELHDYLLFADAASELDDTELDTENNGSIECAPGSRAYCLNGELYILSTAGVWTKIENGLTSF